MSLSKNRQILVLLALVITVLLAVSLKTFNSNLKSITRHDVITFTAPANWVIYEVNKDYDINVGYFKNNNRKDELLCNINAVTAKLGRSPSFEQFLNTSMSGQMFLASHKQVEIHKQEAWRGSYALTSEKIRVLTHNDRILFNWKGVYVDITLTYRQSTESLTSEICQKDFGKFLEDINLL